jgi:hypothetical protein
MPDKHQTSNIKPPSVESQIVKSFHWRMRGVPTLNAELPSPFGLRRAFARRQILPSDIERAFPIQ